MVCNALGALLLFVMLDMLVNPSISDLLGVEHELMEL